MATKLGKPVAREVTVSDGGSLDALTMIFTLTAEGITIRQKNKSRSVLLPYSAAWLRANVLEADTVVAKKPRRRIRRGSLLRGV